MHWKEKMAMHNIHALECTQNYIAWYLMMICMQGVSLQCKPWALKVSTCLQALHCICALECENYALEGEDGNA